MPKTRRDDTLFSPAGDFRHKVTVLLNSSTAATLGTRGEASYSSTISWTARAKIDTLGGNEGLLTRQLFPTASYRVTMRYDSRLTERCRIQFGNSTLYVLAIDDVEQRSREHTCVCGSER